MSEDNERTDVGVSLVESVGPEARSLLKEYGELALDALTNSEVVDKIPVLGTVITLTKLRRSVPDLLLARKIESFLQGCEVTEENRARFLLEYADKKGRRRVGESLLLLLERSDDLEKPPLLGSLFSLLVTQELSEEEMLYAARMLDRIDLADLRALNDAALVADLPAAPRWRLSNAGVIEGPKSGSWGHGGIHWNESVPTPLGSVLLSVFRQHAA